MWKIYKHTNLENNKHYIGLTQSENVNKRWCGGMGYYGTPFFSAILEYGWKNFSHTIIEDNIPTKELAFQREAYWINYYDSYNNGYNSTTGATLPRKLTKEYKQGVSHPIKCIETNMIFPTLKAAAKWCGLKDSTKISRCARHQPGCKSAGKHPITKEKLHWEFID